MKHLTIAAISHFFDIANEVSNLPFEKASVEILDDNAIKFSLRFEGNMLIMITKPLVELFDVKDNQVVYSIFINKKRIASNVSETENFTEELMEYISAGA